jgi:hypothetical protein
MKILGARANRKGVESSVLPVIRDLLAMQEAKKLGEDWEPVQSKRQKRQMRSARDGLLAVPGVTRVGLPDDKAQRRQRRKSRVAAHLQSKRNYDEVVPAKEDSAEIGIGLTLDDADAFPDLSQMRSGRDNPLARRPVKDTSWPIKAVADSHLQKQRTCDEAVAGKEDSAETGIGLKLDDAHAFADLLQIRSGKDNPRARRPDNVISWPVKSPQASSRILFSANFSISKRNMSDEEEEDESTKAPTPVDAWD